jgi:hypothetical protein
MKVGSGVSFGLSFTYFDVLLRLPFLNAFLFLSCSVDEHRRPVDDSSQVSCT